MMNTLHTLETNSLEWIALPTTRSKLVQQNGGVLYGCRLAGLEGRFRKDHPVSRAYGRWLCDMVKERFGCGGFFTSDELPRYGISRTDMHAIYEQMGKCEQDGTLLLLFAYDRERSERICAFLLEQLPPPTVILPN